MQVRQRERLSRAQARRVALAAQGFGTPRPERAVGMRDVQSVISRLGQFQIDSINVVRRAHYLPLYSRLGPYDPALLDRAAHRAPRRMYEYWGHAASLIDVRLQPQLRFRMRDGFRDVWRGVERAARDNPNLVDWVRDQVADRGPLTAREIEYVEDRSKTNWGWNWSTVKTVLEWLFYCGEVTSARRNGQFERVYDLPERVFPATVLDVPDPSPEDSVRELVRHAATALGVASEFCLRDYFRTSAAMTRQAVTDLVDAGELLPVQVEGWEKPQYLWHQARVPRRVDARALLSPFDSMIFERARLERIFDFFYRIEIYVPEPKRQYGYYVYPFLLGERFAARVDLKADRAADRLRVNSAWLEPGEDPTEVAVELAAELRTLADWLGLSTVAVAGKGDLAEPLSGAVKRAA
ncbi:winged helix-turn-helix domain-containing protein [Microlunatus sp. GCM10028923]|uniref:winged helix-turn-helix domain-containing protein n=1 Tax=Microlunatus sp. GCM10028923 TaxID=3273400 RepID=UPI00360B2010